MLNPEHVKNSCRTQRKFPETVQEVSEFRGETTVNVAKAAIAGYAASFVMTPRSITTSSPISPPWIILLKSRALAFPIFFLDEQNGSAATQSSCP